MASALPWRTRQRRRLGGWLDERSPGIRFLVMVGLGLGLSIVAVLIIIPVIVVWLLYSVAEEVLFPDHGR